MPMKTTLSQHLRLLHSFPPLTQPLRTPVKEIHRVLGSYSTSHSSAYVGNKRSNTTLPARARVFTPLIVSTPEGPASASANLFDCLVSLPAPWFTARTPPTKAETEVHLRKQMDTLDGSGDESEHASFSAGIIDARIRQEEEVVESVSPGGHINKRRTRSRPLSDELLAVSSSPKPVSQMSFDCPIADQKYLG
jgi:mitosis inhibitor protein kinase SWE1